MDFNPFGVTTDSLLYSWDELLSSKQNYEKVSNNDDTLDDNSVCSKLELRIIENNFGISTGQYSLYGQPRESIEILLGGKSEAESQLGNDLAELIKNNINIQKTEDDKN